MSYYIRKRSKVALLNLFLATDIDSSGMSVHWTEKENADKFATKELADGFAKRVLERYPEENLQVE